MYYIRLVEADMNPREGGLEDFVLPHVPAVGDKITVAYSGADEIVYEVVARTFHVEFSRDARQLSGGEDTAANVSVVVKKPGSAGKVLNGGNF